MSLGYHGDDREVDRAQHLFRHGAKEHRARHAPTPDLEKDATHIDLLSSRNLLSRMAPRNYDATLDALHPDSLQVKVSNPLNKIDVPNRPGKAAGKLNRRFQRGLLPRPR
jgi:hypothetical protein